ncbi:MAG: DUF3311 domain-containing protein [Firmicutes bacterium]|nr:DUF3311 domain-containing protein [Bacillota bacterium]
MVRRSASAGGSRWWYLLLLLPFVATLLPPIYNRATPALAGLPFFYWYQLAWVVVSALITLLVYALTPERPEARGTERGKGR